MALNFGFWLLEGARGLVLHRLTAVVAILGMTLTLWLFGLLYLLWSNLQEYRKELLQGVKLEAFLETGLNPESHSAIGEQIRQIDGITEVEYISTEDAAEIFAREFAAEVFGILEVNPLPASFKATLAPGKQSLSEAEKLVRVIDSIPGVEEVVFQSGVLELLQSRFDAVSRIIIIGGVFLFLGTMLVFLQGIRLSLRERRSYIYSLLMTGASHLAVRLPFIVEGTITGLVSGGAALLLILITRLAIDRYIFSLDFPDWMYFIALAGGGAGISGSVAAGEKKSSDFSAGKK